MAKLRPYQLKAKQELYGCMAKYIPHGLKKYILCLPTGAGKTTLFCEIVKDGLIKNKNVLIVVDATKLIDQTSERLHSMGIYHGFIKAGRKEDRSKKVQLCSIQTIINREFPPADLIIIDECHVSYSESYRRLFDHYPNAVVIGVTATPERLSKYESLLEIYNKMVIPITIAELIDLGYLVPFQSYVLPTADLSGIKIIKGDFDNTELSERMAESMILNRAVDEWIRLGDNHPTLAFCVNVNHAKALSTVFNNREIPAICIEADTTDAKRNSYYQQLISGDLKVITCINTLTKGVDIPEVGCILSCRPTKSRAMYIQAAGRGMRPASNKDDCIYLDQAGNIDRFGIEPTEYTPPPLAPPKNKADKGEAPTKLCPKCGEIVLTIVSICPKCGHLFSAYTEDKAHGDLIPYEQLFVGIKKKERRKYSTLARLAVKKGYLPGYAFNKFVDAFGYAPDSKVIQYAIYGEHPTQEDKEAYWLYLCELNKTKKLPLDKARKAYKGEFGVYPTTKQNLEFTIH